MNVTELLQFVDQVVQKQTGEHLDDLEKAILKGLWQGQTYNQIADESGYNSQNYIGDVSRKLFKTLSEQLGEDINKYNFCWTIERVINSQFVGLVNTKISLCSNHPKTDKNQSHEEKSTSQSFYHDLTIAPKITHFYGRERELQTLSHFLINQNARLISVLGLPGIGKTTLIKRFVDLNLQNFNIIIWKNIKLSDSLDSIIAEIFKAINSEFIQTENKLTQLFNLFRQQKCLIIIDNIQELFTPGQFAGQYKAEYKDYKTFLTMITEIEHQSSLILISQEQCQEMICIDEELYPVKCLELQGLDNTDILKNQKLKDEESLSKLINLYEGNPVYLQDISSLIRNIFQGKISDFLSEGLLLTENMKYQLSELFNRLSTVEQQIVLEMSKSNQPVNREQLRESLSLSSMELINGLQSLKRRYLVTTIESDKTLFILSPVFREYVIITP
ncbi:ATP-binding protein [Dolichospermum sp. UHCC 0684]|jgi:AAA+ ATPase superfamily predicted ATPase|uniref:ATP-binding protein n=1 Tax=unclassified Dolichospermum TaxID=2622029 RepID=UPI00144888E2|nr:MULTISPECIES: ATP-binding protein [unclassified Dolichospermum]MEA5528051.1 ATP-binding protein [Dolichospermum sp. UHCC 0684]MTJ33421.1 ATP-binding protein [Dolichospermum sp. UHCC 0260]